MASPKVMSKGLVSFLELRNRCPSDQILYLNKLIEKNRKYKDRLSVLNVGPPPIDWEYYKRNVRAEAVGMVERFQKKYTILLVPRPEDKNTPQIEKLKEDVKNEVVQFIKKSNKHFEAYQEEIERIKSLMGYSQMTWEDYWTFYSERGSDFAKRPTLWSHAMRKKLITKTAASKGGDQKKKNEKEKPGQEKEKTKKKDDVTRMNQWENHVEIQRFRKYLQIPSVHPDVDYEPCIKFLTEQAKELGLPVNVYRVSSEKHPILVMTWTGTEPTLPSILLNSHMDVVPVYEDKWSHPPFAAEIDSEGRIFARGAQDMKCVGMQYLAAIKSLKANNVQCRRSIHISFVPDEEIGSVHGMKAFVLSKEFCQLNVGFGLDEGIPSPTNTFLAFNTERSTWQITFIMRGTTGHGSLLHSNTVGEKFHCLLNKMMDMRAEQVECLKRNPELTMGDVTTINLTIVRGGVQVNVVPTEMEASFDVRLSNDVNHAMFLNLLEQWCKEAGGVEMKFIQKMPYVEPTKIDSSNPYWVAFKSAVNELKLDVVMQVLCGATDANSLRKVGIPAIGFSPMNQTPILLHDHDEYIQADIYLRGIEIYKKIIEKVGNA